MKGIIRSFAFITIIAFTSCISFKGVVIPNEVKTFYIAPVERSASVYAPAEVDQIYFEDLQRTIRRQSRLNYNDEEPDAQFSPTLQIYRLEAVAPIEGTTVAFSRLYIEVKVEYEDFTNEQNNKTISVNDQRDYDSSINLTDVEIGLVEEIFEEINERIFNQIYSDW